MPKIDAAVGMQSGEEARLRQLASPTIEERFRDFGLRIAMGRKSGSDRRDTH